MPTRKPARRPLKKQEIIERLADTTGWSRNDVQEFLDALAKLAQQEVAQTGEFTIPGLGTLTHTPRPARQGRNPATGAAIKIPAPKVVRFRADKSLKSTLAGDNTTDSDI